MIMQTGIPEYLLKIRKERYKLLLSSFANEEKGKAIT